MYLNKWCESCESGLHELVLPPPVGAAAASADGGRAVVAAGQPLGQITDLRLGKRGVLLSVEDGRVVRPMDFPVVLPGELSESHQTHDGVGREEDWLKIESRKVFETEFGLIFSQ